MCRLNIFLVLLLLISSCKKDKGQITVENTTTFSSDNFKYFPGYRIDLWDSELLSDGSMIMAGNGSEDGVGDLDPFILRINSNRDLERINFFEDIGFAYSNVDFVQTDDDTFIYLSRTRRPSPATDYDIDIREVSSFGNTFWSNQIGADTKDEYGMSICKADDGDFIILGQEKDADAFFFNDYLLKKVSDNGEVIWSKALTETENITAKRVLYSSNLESIFALVYLRTVTGNESIKLLKFDSDGNLQTELNVDSNTSAFNSGSIDMKLLDNDEIMVFYSGLIEVSTIKKFNSSLVELSSITEVEISPNVLQDVIITSDGNFLTLSFSSSVGNGELDIILTKINTDGEVIWRKVYGGELIDAGNSIFESNQRFIISGTSNSELFILETDLEGNPM